MLIIGDSYARACSKTMKNTTASIVGRRRGCDVAATTGRAKTAVLATTTGGGAVTVAIAVGIVETRFDGGIGAQTIWVVRFDALLGFS